MPLAVAQTGHNAPAFGPVVTTVTLAGPTTVGNVLVAIVNAYQGDPGLTSVTDSKGNTWSRDYVVHGGIGDLMVIAVYSSVLTVAGTAHAVTFTYPASTLLANLDVAEVSGMLGAGRLDVTVPQLATSAPPYTAGPSGTLAQNGEILFASLGVDQGGAGTITQDPTWVLIGEAEDGSQYISSVVYKIVNVSTAASHVWASTFPSGPYMTVLASYKAAADLPVGQISINEATDVIAVLGSSTAPTGGVGVIAAAEVTDGIIVVGTFTPGTNVTGAVAMAEITDTCSIVGTITNPTPTFRYPVAVSGRKWVDQLGAVILLKDVSSWGMVQNLSNAEITEALEGVADRHFNCTLACTFGVRSTGVGWAPYQNKAGQNAFVGTPWQTAIGPAWASMDWYVSESTRLGLVAGISLWISQDNDGPTFDMIAATNAQMQARGTEVGARYASYPNVVWHVMGDKGWGPTDAIGQRVDAFFVGIKNAEGGTPRLMIAEPYNGGNSYAMFIANQADHGVPGGYVGLKLSANSPYHYNSNAVEMFDSVWNMATTPAGLPSWDCEPPYVGAGHYGGGANERQNVRERNYATIIRGGLGINWGDEAWWVFDKPGLFPTAWDWHDVMTNPEAFDAQHCWDLVDALVLDAAWSPNDVLVTTGTGSGDTKAAAGMGATTALAYFPSNRSVVVNTTQMPGTGAVRLRWYDPTAGTFADIATSEAQSASRPVTYPANHADGSADYVLVVDLAASVAGSIGAVEVTDTCSITGTTTGPVNIAGAVAVVEATDVLAIVGTFIVGPVSGVVAAVEDDDAALIVAYQPSAPTTEGGLGVTVSNRTPTLRVTVTPRGNA